MNGDITRNTNETLYVTLENSLGQVLIQFGAFGILEYPTESHNWLTEASPEWLTITESLPAKNTNKINYEVKESVIDIIREGNQADLTFYNTAVDFLLNQSH